MAEGRKDRKKEKTEEVGGELTAIPNDKYRKFFDKFKDVETLDVAQWKVAHVLGYFCKKYKEHFNVDYQFKFNNENPNKCYEVWRINTISAKLSTNPQILKDYIDWVFEQKVNKAKRRFTSVSFIADDEFINYYKINVLLANKKDLHVDRSTALDANLSNIFQAIVGDNFKTYGELCFIYQAVKSGSFGNDEYRKNWSTAIEQAKKDGFDLEDISKRVV